MSLVVAVPDTSVKTHTMVPETISFSLVTTERISCYDTSIVVLLDDFHRFLSLDSFTIVVDTSLACGFKRHFRPEPFDLTDSTVIDDSAD
jgi:hypothetical protein